MPEQNNPTDSTNKAVQAQHEAELTENTAEYFKGEAPVCSEHVERVRAEREQLIERTQKLRSFLATDDYHAMPTTDKKLMVAQLNVMESYRTVLEMRIHRHEDRS